MEEQLLSK